MRRPLRASSIGGAGFTALELLLAAAIVITIVGISLPATADALDHIRAGMAARYLESRIMQARVEAIRRAGAVALRFEPVASDYAFSEYRDGNGNGVRAADIASGLDRAVAAPVRLRDQFPGIGFGLLAGVPDLDGTRATAAGDGVRVGTSRLLTLGPDGTATSGTLYLHGRRSQYAIRVLGATARTRLLRYDPGRQQWIRQ